MGPATWAVLPKLLFMPVLLSKTSWGCTQSAVCAGDPGWQLRGKRKTRKAAAHARTAPAPSGGSAHALRVVGVGGPVGVVTCDGLAGSHVHLARREAAHGDAFGHRADRHAQVAAHAFGFVDL